MNKVSLVGNVVNDLELKEYKNDEGEGKYVRFTLAINEYSVRKNERIATFVEVVAFGKKAVILAREDIATFAAGGDYKQSNATGFISIYGLPTKVQAIVNSEKEGE